MKFVLTLAIQALLGAPLTASTSADAVGNCGDDSAEITATDGITSLQIDGFKTNVSYKASPSAKGKIVFEDFESSWVSTTEGGVMTITAGEKCGMSSGMDGSGSLAVFGLSSIAIGYPLLSAGAFLMNEFSSVAAERSLMEDTHDNDCEVPTVTVTVFTPEIRKPPQGENPCDGTKPTEGFDNQACFAEDGTVPSGPQAGANVSKGYVGDLEYAGVAPLMDPFYESDLCPVNVHWHLGAEHLSDGEYDANGVGPSEITHRRLAAGKVRKGNLCGFYDEDDSKFTDHYDWKFCQDMEVGQTYEVHWPHSKGGACGTPNQYQTPFYDGVFCYGDRISLDSLPQHVGVQAQVFTIVNDESYYYPDLMRGMIVESDMGADMAVYVGSTTGTTRDNTMCSSYTPITWQVDRKCHMISASSFDKMCADMMSQRADMSDDIHPHGSREVVADGLAANNLESTSHSP